MKYKKWVEKHKKDLTGKNIIVTGANSGLGFKTCFYLAYMNANIIMACRNIVKANEARREIISQIPNANIEVMEYDQASLSSIDKFINQYNEMFGKIDGIICNAGVYYPKSNYKTKDGFDITFGTNYLGVYHLIEGLSKENMLDNSRVVLVTSLTATTCSKKYNFDNAKSLSKNKVYGFSKLCIAKLFAYLDRQNTATSFRLVHPGITATNILNHEKTGFPNWFSKIGHDFLYVFVHKVDKAALVSIYGLLDENEEKKYITPRGLFAISGLPKKKKIPNKFLDNDIIEDTEKFIKEVKR